MDGRRPISSLDTSATHSNEYKHPMDDQPPHHASHRIDTEGWHVAHHFGQVTVVARSALLQEESDVHLTKSRLVKARFQRLSGGRMCA